MYNFPIGIIIDSFKTETIKAIEKVAKLGATGVQMFASKGENSPGNLTNARKKEIMDCIQSNGLVFSALCGDFGFGFVDAKKNKQLVEESKRVLDLAKEFGTNIVTTHIGVIPENSSHPRYKIMQEACFELSRYADSIDAHFAIETGPEKAITLKKFLDELDSRGVAVNLDPANFVMVTGDNPVDAVYTLKDYIVHTHVKDGKRLFYKDPEIIYGLTEEDMLNDKSFIELPLGEGDVDFDSYFAALDDIGYKGFLTIEREVGNEPERDIKTAVKFIKEKIEKH